jgi:hypothetical protein
VFSSVWISRPEIAIDANDTIAPPIQRAAVSSEEGDFDCMAACD